MVYAVKLSVGGGVVYHKHIGNVIFFSVAVLIIQAARYIFGKKVVLFAVNSNFCVVVVDIVMSFGIGDSLLSHILGKVCVEIEFPVVLVFVNLGFSFALADIIIIAFLNNAEVSFITLIFNPAVFYVVRFEHSGVVVLVKKVPRTHTVIVDVFFVVRRKVVVIIEFARKLFIGYVFKSLVRNVYNARFDGSVSAERPVIYVSYKVHGFVGNCKMLEVSVFQKLCVVPCGDGVGLLVVFSVVCAGCRKSGAGNRQRAKHSY